MPWSWAHVRGDGSSQDARSSSTTPRASGTPTDSESKESCCPELERNTNCDWSCGGTGKIGGICKVKNRVAIVGAGLTLFRRRMLESPKELSFEATKMALDSAGPELKAIRPGVLSSAADAFAGTHMQRE